MAHLGHLLVVVHDHRRLVLAAGDVYRHNLKVEGAALLGRLSPAVALQRKIILRRATTVLAHVDAIP